MTRFSQLLGIILLFAFTATSIPVAAAKKDGSQLIDAGELQEWLTYFSSDELEGRAIYSEGLGLAAAYIADQLKSWGVRPGGDQGTFFQRVRILGVKSDNKSTITVEAHGDKRTFKNGEGISFPVNVGGKRSITVDQVEFVGYGLDALQSKHMDYAGKNVKDKLVVFLGASGPEELDARSRRLLFGRARYATEQKGAAAAIGPGLSTGGARPQGGGANAAAGQGAGQGGFFMGPPIERADFTTVQRLDNPISPNISAQDDFFEFLFSGQEMPYSELKSRGAEKKPLPRFTLKDVKITINIDADYRVVRTQYSRNVVGIVDGKDSRLRNTYIAFGAHYDHMGYSEGEVVKTDSGSRRAEPRGRVTQSALDDRIWNGADDDGSGSIAILGVAKAFALGPRPRRSMLFVWHTGEERGLFGSRYFADYPTVPIDSIVAQINLDMVGRNREDKPEESNSVYAIGDDRISTELHNIAVDSDLAMPKPLKLDYELNDPSDPEQFYFRSDHYSYAAKGIPIIFLTTGIHPDYHANTDSADKINYEKMARITRLSYELAMRLGNLDHPPVRDNQGPRAGKGSEGKLTF
ncbi:MAG TPA: M28 family peptidase [Acidobacteriota bacterium]|nr:M28 family peptidase [Acidobacteriota bacterium]